MKQKSGFTIVELIVTIALASLITALGTSLFLFSTKTNTKTTKEFDLQSSIRIMSQKVNSATRDAAGVFILHRENANNLTKEWNYIMLNSDKTKMVEHRWNPTINGHEVLEIFSSLDGVTLDLEFEKTNSPDKDRLLKYFVEIKKGTDIQKIVSEVEGVNTLQIVDRSYDKIPNVLAYRNDDRISDVSNAQAVLSMVLDVSTSMDSDMDGNLTYNYQRKRIYKMKEEANRFVDQLSKQSNINIGIVPFSTSANDPKPMRNAKLEKNAIKKSISDLIIYSNRGTNTGDGLRRGFYSIKEFNEREENKSKDNKNFLIILVDGVTTFSSMSYEDIIIRSRSTHINSPFTLDGKQYNRVYKYQNGGSYFFVDPHNPNNHDQLPSDTITFSGITYNRIKDAFYYRHNDYAYFMGDNNINENRTSSNGNVYGLGGNLDYYGTEYVYKLGELVKDYKKGTIEEVKTYVIGFSNVSNDHASLNTIGEATNAVESPDGKKFFTAGSSEALEEIFKAIQKDISDALWHIGGPN